jgi:hypothetical protein
MNENNNVQEIYLLRITFQKFPVQWLLITFQFFLPISDKYKSKNQLKFHNQPQHV